MLETHHSQTGAKRTEIIIPGNKTHVNIISRQRFKIPVWHVTFRIKFIDSTLNVL